MKRLDLSQPAIGSWCQIGHPSNAEILAKAGFTWVAADAEHGEFSDTDLSNFCRAVRQSPECTPLVRVTENAVMPIRRALDLGAAGVIVPLVNTAQEAANAVKAAHYPPKGIRGFAWQRANGWGADFETYVRDFSPLVIVMIESKTAVEQIEQILAVEGVDACFIGPYDLSGSYGIPGQTGHQIIKDACSRVAEASRKAGKAAGQHIITPSADNVKTALQQGFTFLALGMDSYFLGTGARQVLELAK